MQRPTFRTYPNGARRVLDPAPPTRAPGNGLASSTKGSDTMTPNEPKTAGHGTPTYAGSYRIAYACDGARFLEVRRVHGWQRIADPIPVHIRGAYAAAARFMV